MKILFVFVCLFATLALAGCGDVELESATITRDDARTGGSLSFVYDSKERTIHIGGEGEVVQYSSADESKGISEGCRVGLKVTAPDESLDISDATLEMNGVKYASGDFLETVNGQKQRFFNIYPLVSEDDMQVNFIVKWADGTAKQEYKVIIVEGTSFADKDGDVD